MLQSKTDIESQSERFFCIRLRFQKRNVFRVFGSEVSLSTLLTLKCKLFTVSRCCMYYLCRSKPTSRLQPSSAGVLQFWAPAPDTHDAAYWRKRPLIRVSTLLALRGHRIGLLLQSNWPDVCKKWQGSLLQSIYSYSIYIAMNSPHKMPKLLPFFSKYIFKVLNRQKGSHNKHR